MFIDDDDDDDDDDVVTGKRSASEERNWIGDRHLLMLPRQLCPTNRIIQVLADGRRYTTQKYEIHDSVKCIIWPFVQNVFYHQSFNMNSCYVSYQAWTTETLNNVQCVQTKDRIVPSIKNMNKSNIKHGTRKKYEITKV